MAILYECPFVLGEIKMTSEGVWTHYADSIAQGLATKVSGTLQKAGL